MIFNDNDLVFDGRALRVDMIVESYNEYRMINSYISSRLRDRQSVIIVNMT